MADENENLVRNITCLVLGASSIEIGLDTNIVEDARIPNSKVVEIVIKVEEKVGRSLGIRRSWDIFTLRDIINRLGSKEA